MAIPTPISVAFRTSNWRVLTQTATSDAYNEPDRPCERHPEESQRRALLDEGAISESPGRIRNRDRGRAQFTKMRFDLFHTAFRPAMEPRYDVVDVAVRIDDLMALVLASVSLMSCATAIWNTTTSPSRSTLRRHAARAGRRSVRRRARANPAASSSPILVTPRVARADDASARYSR
jgi:hypothetical protein